MEYNEFYSKNEVPLGRSISFDNISSLNHNSSQPIKQMFLDDTHADLNKNTVDRNNFLSQSKGTPKSQPTNGKLSDTISLPDRSQLLLGLDNDLENKLKLMELKANKNKPPIEIDINHNGEVSIDSSDYQFLYDKNISLGDTESNQFTGNQLASDQYEEEDFTNVDEIDGPIMGQLNNTMPKKDDTKGREFLHESDTLKDEDYNMPVDAGLQESLDKRAIEIGGSTLDSLSEPLSKIEVNLNTDLSLENELPLWFSLSDYTYLPQTKSQFTKIITELELFNNNDDYASSSIKDLLTNLIRDPKLCIMALLYICLGNNAQVTNSTDQIASIRRNVFLILEDEENLITIVNSFFDIAQTCRDNNHNLKLQSTLFFYSMSILFIIINVCIESRLETSKTETVKNSIKILDDLQLMSFLTKYIEHWRWNSRLSMKIRNIISLLFKVILLQFGDEKTFASTKKDILILQNIVTDNDEEQDLSNSKPGITKQSISPLNYQAFREDIISRYPNFIPPQDNLPKDIDNSNSLSQFIEIPRSKIRNSMNQLLSVPGQHLATPAPSPPDSPTLSPISTIPKQRRSFQTNMAFPCLYPSDDEDGFDDLTKRISVLESDNSRNENDVIIPHSVSEATKILKCNLRIGLSNKQLWYERDLFMMSERGWKAKTDNDPFNYSIMNNPDDNPSIDVMKRIEDYYKTCLASFNSLVFVLIQIMESNINNACYKGNDVQNKIPLEVLNPTLEVTRAKEIVLKSSTGILYYLLKWFKLNHVLKYEHLCVLLYDSHYINIATSVLNNYSVVYIDKLFKKTLSPNHSIWIELQKLGANTSKQISQTDNNSTKLFDQNILLCFTYLFDGLSHITRDKTQRLKDLPLSIGLLFKRYYRVFNPKIYHSILKIVKELTPFKNKRWKSEHMDLISGVYLYEQLELTENWVTGKDISNELSDACGQEMALRALLQFYNFFHYESSMISLGYTTRVNSDQGLINNESENINH